MAETHTHTGLPPTLRRSTLHGDTWGIGPFTLGQAENPAADFTGTTARAAMRDDDGTAVIGPTNLDVTISEGAATIDPFEIRDWADVPLRNASYLIEVEATLPAGTVLTLVRVLLTVVPDTARTDS